MVRFVFGSSGSGKSEYILRDIQRNLSQSQNKIILIVPEQHTVSTERRTAKRYAPSAALRMEVTNFTRLSDSISRKVGGLTYSARTRGADMLMLWRALLSVHGGLSELACNGGDPVSVLPTVYSALRELTLGGITERELSSAADSLEEIEGETSLSRRTRDLALIGEAWRQLAEDEYASFEDPVMKIKRCASESGYFDGCDVYVDSFYSMTGAQLAALSEIIRHAASVTITIPMKDRHADGIHLAGVKSFYKSVLGAALRYSEAEFVTLEGSFRYTTRELYTLSEHLWDYSFDGNCDTELPSVPESAVLYSVSDRYEEAVADELKERRQMTGGQIAVCEDGKLYMLMPLPEGVSKEEVDQAAAAGIIKLYDGMMTDEPKAWEERDGALWLEIGEGMSEDGWVKLSGDDGYLTFMTTRYVKAE